MPKKSMELLTESMFYVLMALQTGPTCGIDAAEFIERAAANDRAGAAEHRGVPGVVAFLNKVMKKRVFNRHG